MSYLRAEEILPKEVLELVQQYVSGKAIYVPCREKQPGQSSGLFLCSPGQKLCPCGDIGTAHPFECSDEIRYLDIELSVGLVRGDIDQVAGSGLLAVLLILEGKGTVGVS